MNEAEPLPQGWRRVRLGETCEINPSRPKQFSRAADAITTFVPMEAVDEKLGKILTPKIRPYSRISKGYTYFEERDVLFSKITPCMQNGKHAIARNLIDGIGFGTTEFHVLRPSSEVLPEWIHFFIRQPYFLQEAAAYFVGAVGQQRVPESFLTNYVIPLPPLPEQKIIVAKVEELMKEIEHARTACEVQLEAARASPLAYLHQIFESEEVKRWERRRLGEVAKIVNGFGFPNHLQGKTELQFPFIKVADMNLPGNEVYINYAANTVDEVILQELGARAYPPGTIIFPKVGGAIATNKKRILSVPATFDNNVMGVIPSDSVSSEWVYCLLESIDLSRMSRVTAVPSIRQSDIASLAIPFPPLHEQEQIAARIKNTVVYMEKLKVAVETQMETINALPQAILSKAFSGEL